MAASVKGIAVPLRKETTQNSLVVRAGACLCALPLAMVVETLRPLAVERLPGAPEGVLGVSVVRGRPTPVVDARRILEQGCAEPATRLVTLRLGSRSAALAVDAVLGVRSIEAARLEAMSPILGAGAELASAIGSLDDELLLVLRAARLVPNEVWAALTRSEEP